MMLKELGKAALDEEKFIEVSIGIRVNLIFFACIIL